MVTLTALEPRTGRMMMIINGLRHCKVATVASWITAMRRSGLLARLKSWGVPFIVHDAVMPSVSLAKLRSAWLDNRAETIPSGKVVYFPGAQQAYLRQLGADMRARFASLGLEDFSPFILDMDRLNPSRLWIDPVAYVNSHSPRCSFSIVIDDGALGTMTYETYDFDSIRMCVCHYILSRLTDALRNGDAE